MRRVKETRLVAANKAEALGRREKTETGTLENANATVDFSSNSVLFAKGVTVSWRKLKSTR